MDRLRIIPVRAPGGAGRRQPEAQGCPGCRELAALRAQVEALQRQLQAECGLSLARQQEVERLQQQVLVLQKRNRELEAARQGRTGGEASAGGEAGDTGFAGLCSAPSIATIPLDPGWPSRSSR